MLWEDEDADSLTHLRISRCPSGRSIWSILFPSCLRARLIRCNFVSHDDAFLAPCRRVRLRRPIDRPSRPDRDQARPEATKLRTAVPIACTMQCVCVCVCVVDIDSQRATWPIGIDLGHACTDSRAGGHPRRLAVLWLMGWRGCGSSRAENGRIMRRWSNADDRL